MTEPPDAPKSPTPVDFQQADAVQLKDAVGQVLRRYAKKRAEAVTADVLTSGGQPF